MSRHDRSKRSWASTCCTHRLGATSVGSAGGRHAEARPPASAPRRSTAPASGGRRRRWRRPSPPRAVDLPTPPLPVNRRIRIPDPARQQRLDALLEPLQRGVDEDLLALALEHADQRDAHVEGQAVGDLGGAVAAVRQRVGAVEHALQHVALDERPRDLAVAVPVVGQRVLVLDRRDVEGEVDLLGTSRRTPAATTSAFCTPLAHSG